MRYLASSPCMAAATAAWGGWGYLRKPAELFPGTVAKVSPHPKAMTVQRPARRGGGAAVTTVRPPAPPTAPRLRNTGGTQTRPARPPPAPPQGACARFATPSAQAQCEVLAPGINPTHPAAEREGFCRRYPRGGSRTGFLITAPLRMKIGRVIPVRGIAISGLSFKKEKGNPLTF